MGAYVKYEPYIYNGSTWVKYEPYIYNGSSWVKYDTYIYSENAASATYSHNDTDDLEVGN